MTLRLIIVICVLQVITSVICSDYRNNYTRIKRAKYYSNPPPRFYKLPPPPQLVRTPFSYTPPPEYMDGDHPARKPVKVNKNKEGLGDEDFKNLIKHLSKQDFDRILELAAEKDRYSRPFEKRPSNAYNSEQDFQLNKAIQFPDSDQVIHIDDTPPSNFVQIKSTNNIGRDPYVKPDISPYLSPEESHQNEQISYLNGVIEQEFNPDVINHEPNSDSNSHTLYTNSDTMKEERLPKPDNLRDVADFEISYTNNVPTIVKSSSYKLENFANLPLMNYENSKLERVNSYNVPHYTVTSSRNQQPQSLSVSSSFSSPVQPAPPKSLAAEQSDAHLKATKIWTHKSTGTAYILHDDGTLSLERPIRPKRKF
ncbi:unnamed protein product [Pieris macdunnoughi]|uniref:Uncharacterized protein n=1 Tax=Pieris macdunnoughi TaxID=345717 RepID=A0A821RWV2_9NEOP|nr:unnamed protein product [Pieris macdunnoughi]